jgi:integrase
MVTAVAGYRLILRVSLSPACPGSYQPEYRDTRLQTKLTAALVRRHTETEPPARDLSIFDVEVPRLALRLKPPRRAGGPWASLYFVRYTAGGIERRIKVGDPRTMSLDDARRAAKVMLSKVDSGRDPAAESAETRAAWTVKEAWERYAESSDFGKKTQRSQAEDDAVARNHVLRHVGSKKLAELDVPAVRRMLRAVEGDQRTNARKRRLGGPGAARRAVRTLSSLLSWAVNEGQLARNPIIGALRLSGGGERTVILDRPEQYASLFETMDAMVAEGSLRTEVRAFVTLLAATGMRRNEARTLNWGDINLRERRITLRNPKGAKLSRRGAATETVSLPPIAAAALAAIRPDDASPDDAVFVPMRGELMAVNHDWNRIRARAELPDGLVLHSLRHSIGTAGIMAGMSTAEVGKMLRHRNLAVTAKYVHLAEASQSRLQDRAADFLFGSPATPLARSK